jgi:putative NIF3 family GTP cyclohydrolase 1 type 2
VEVTRTKDADLDGKPEIVAYLRADGSVEREEIDTRAAGRPNLVREYEEVGLNHLYAGHYATERFGPRALGEWCRDELGAEVRFIDIPNSV